MGAQERAAAAVSRMDQVRREMAERRALRHRHRAEIREQVRDSATRNAPVIAQAVKELDDVARRRKLAGGWATEKIDRADRHVLGLGIQADDQARTPDHRPPAVTPRHSAEPTPADDQPPARHSTVERPRRPARPPAIEDEDDLSNHSWMTNR